MEKLNIHYSHKNIPLLGEHEYKLILTQKIEDLISKMRWKAHFYINNAPQNLKENYGFRTNVHPPYIKQLAPFESDLTGLLDQILFRSTNSTLFNNMKKDLKNIKQSEKIITKADKSNNLYKLSTNTYKALLHNEVTRFYRKSTSDIELKINTEARDIAFNLGLANRIETIIKKEAFITLKDHKGDFNNNPSCRLINPTRSFMGQISKKILQDICEILRIATNVNQWRSTSDCVNWFKDIEFNRKNSFIIFDIKNFYPSITRKVLLKAIDLAKQFTDVPGDKVDLILHCRRTMLLHNGELWVKQNDQGFDVTMGALDGAEICELVGIFLLYELSTLTDISLSGLYRDDGLILLERGTPRTADIMRKKITKLFKSHGFDIEIECNLKVVDFLDVTLNLNNGVVTPFKKSNHDPQYISVDSNHPKQIFRNVPKGIATRLSNNSSSEEVFDQHSLVYQNALNIAGYNVNLKYLPPQSRSKKNRPRQIIWFNPPYNKNVINNIGQFFLHLIDNHFRPNNSLHKIFNRSNLKVSYSTVANFSSYIVKHNNALLYRGQKPVDPPCNCTAATKPCPLNGSCLAKNIVYRATVKFQGFDSRTYVGSTSLPFKTRYGNHIKSFKTKKYGSDTALSKYIWHMKDSGNLQHKLKWEIVKRAPVYTPGAKSCRLCMEEKLSILSDRGNNSLNKRTEILNRCSHKNGCLLYRIPTSGVS